MKNLILFASLFLFLFTSCTEENDSDTAPNIDTEIESRTSPPWCFELGLDHGFDDESKCNDCCWTFDIFPNDAYTHFQIKFEDEPWGEPIEIGEFGTQIEKCFDKEGGQEGILIVYWDGFEVVCKSWLQIPVQPCLPPQSSICWEDFIGYFDCATSITLLLPDGQEQTVDFTSNYTCDVDLCVHELQEPCDICPCSVPTPVEGGFCCILNQITHSINSLGFEVTLPENDPFYGGDCKKENPWGGYDILPGYYITSEVVIVSVNGNDCNGSTEVEVPFENNACP